MIEFACRWNNAGNWKRFLAGVIIPYGLMILSGFGIAKADPTPRSVPFVGTQRQRGGRDYTAAFDKVVQTVRDHFYDKTLHGVDWTKVTTGYRAQLRDVKSKAEFSTLINTMLGELKASHTGYLTQDDAEYYMLSSVMAGDLQGRKVEQIGVMGRQEASGFFVAGVLDGGPAEKAGIKSGDQLVAADGEPFTSAGSFRGKEGKSVSVRLRRGGQEDLRTVTVMPEKRNVLKAFLDATRESARVLNVEGKRLGYVHLWTMGNDAFREALDSLVLHKLYDTDGLILDLRDGYGGIPWGYSDVFVRPDVTWEQQMRGENPLSRHTGYGKPMVVLINGGTRSAKEFLTYQFKAAKRATVVGTRTAGAFLGAGAYQINDDALLELPVVGLRLDKIRLEGAGVAPDILVRSEASYTERDTQLAQARQTLLELIRQRAAEIKAH